MTPNPAPHPQPLNQSRNGLELARGTRDRTALLIQLEAALFA
jgi:hypothetical protein